MTARVASLLLACALFAPLAKPARAASQTFVVLDYEIVAGAGDCPDADAFRANVQRQLGYDPFRPDASRRVAVQIARRELGFGGRIRWSDGDGRWVGDRHLSSGRPECHGIAASLAFSVAVQIQLMATLAPDAPPPATATEPPAPAAEASTSLTAADATATTVAPAESDQRAAETSGADDARPVTLSVGIGPSVGIGLAPATTGIGRLFVSAGLGWLSLELAGQAALPVTQNAAGGGGFTLDRLAAEAAACGHAGPIAACVTGTVGRLQARGFGVDARASPAGFFSQVGGRLMATHPVGDRFFADLRADGLVLVSRSTVTLNEMRVWTTPRVAAVFGVDVGARFF